MKRFYLYDPNSGFYLQHYDAQESPEQPGKFIAPKFSTDEAPTFLTGTWPQRINDAWVNIPDHRGAVWDKITGEAVTWTELGALPLHLTAVPKPNELSTWVDNQWVLDVDLVMTAKLSEFKAACAAAIVGGVHCDALGVDHLYPTSKDDQAFLTARYSKAVALGSVGAPYKFMCADGNGVWARRDHTAEQIITVALAVEGHITAQLNKLDTLAEALAEAVDVAAIEAIVW